MEICAGVPRGLPLGLVFHQHYGCCALVHLQMAAAHGNRISVIEQFTTSDPLSQLTIQMSSAVSPVPLIFGKAVTALKHNTTLLVMQQLRISRYKIWYCLGRAARLLDIAHFRYHLGTAAQPL